MDKIDEVETKNKLTKKEYNKKYYEKNKEKIASKLYAKVTCEKCGRCVSHQNLTKHQKSSRCKAKSYDDIGVIIHELKNEVFALKEKDRKAQEDKDQEEKNEQFLGWKIFFEIRIFYIYIWRDDTYQHVQNVQEYIQSGGQVELLTKLCIMIPFKDHEEHTLKFGSEERRVRTCKLVPDPNKSYTVSHEKINFSDLVGEYVLDYYGVLLQQH